MLYLVQDHSYHITLVKILSVSSCVQEEEYQLYLLGEATKNVRPSLICLSNNLSMLLETQTLVLFIFLFFPLFICVCDMCVYMFLHMWACVCECACEYVYRYMWKPNVVVVKNRPLSVHLIPWDRLSQSNPGLIDLATLPSQLVLEIPCLWNVQRIWTQVLMLLWQALWSLSYFPSPLVLCF